MSHVQYIDELVREYLLFRGFTLTLKSFDTELKVDKDKGFRVDRIVDNLLQLIYSYDLNGIRELMTHFDQRMFSKLDQEFAPVVKKLENSIYKFYVINALVNNKIEKVTEFFSKMVPEIQGQAEWKEWYEFLGKLFYEMLMEILIRNHLMKVDYFNTLHVAELCGTRNIRYLPLNSVNACINIYDVLPYIRNAEDNPTFSMYFTRQWQDTLLVTLHNFLSLIYQAMPQPILTNYEKEAFKIRQLQEENETLKQKLATFIEYKQQQQRFNNMQDNSHVPPDIIDDFYVIAAETPSVSNTENTVKSLKNLIRTIGVGLPTSPLLGRKSGNIAVSNNTSNVESARSGIQEGCRKHSKQRLGSSGANAVMKQSSGEESGLAVAKRSISLDRENTKSRTNRDPSLDNNPERKNSSRQVSINKIPPFLLLSQDSFDGHKASITQCRFNSCGSTVASTDADGVVKIWSPAPSPVLMGTSTFKTAIRCLDWVSKNERFIVFGSEEGVINLYDTKDFKCVWETGTENNSPLRDSKVYSVSSSPTDTSFVCSVVSNKSEHKLLLYDIKAKKLERSLSLDCDPSVYVTCCTHNHNGQLLIAGCSDGVVRTYDLRHAECVDQWHAHKDFILGMQLSVDHTACYSLGADNKLCRRSLNGNNQGPTWDATLSTDPLSSHPGHKFTLDQSAKYILMSYGQNNGGTIFKITNVGLTSVLALKGHKTPTTACDWATANQCCTCVTASTDGKICVSTLLMP